MFDHALASGIHRDVNQILRQRTDLEGKVVVDLACGDGRTTHLLRELGAHVKPFDIMPGVYSLDGEPPAYADVMDSLPIESESVDMVVLQEVAATIPAAAASLPTRKSQAGRPQEKGLENEKTRSKRVFSVLSSVRRGRLEPRFTVLNALHRQRFG